MARTRVRSTFAKKHKAIQNMVKAFRIIPELMANDLHTEIQTKELDGEPINRITGQLINSMDVIKLSADAWALSQNKAQAPYAPRVMVFVAKARAGKPALTLLKERRFPVYQKAIVREFTKMVKDANAGRVYKLNKKNFIRE